MSCRVYGHQAGFLCIGREVSASNCSNIYLSRVQETGWETPLTSIG